MDEQEKKERLAYALSAPLTAVQRAEAIRRYGPGDTRPSEVIVREMRDEWPDRQQ